MAMSVIAALELLSAFNFDFALIQRQDAERPHYDTAWTLNVMFAVGLASVLAIIAFPASDFFDEPRLRAVMQFLAIGMLIQGFENIGVVAFRKDLEFRKEFVMRIAQKVCGTAITLPLAFALRSYWALVIGIVAGNVLSVLVSYYAHPFRPRFSLAARSHLFSFSKWLLVNNFLFFLRDRTPDFLLGKIGGASALGLYTISNEISGLPTGELVAPINRAVLPGYAKMAAEPEALRRGFLDVIGLIAIVALPAGLGIAATSHLIVGVVLGDKWMAAAPIISILGIAHALNALQTNCGNMHYAMGNPRLLTNCVAIEVLLLVPSMIWAGQRYGAQGVALAYLVNIALIAVPLNYAVLQRKLALPVHQLLALFWRPFVAGGVMYVSTVFVAKRFEPSFGALLGVICLGAAIYVLMVVGMWWGAGRPVGPEQTVVENFIVPTWHRIVAGHRRRSSG
jgi:lipopolysaccharide exporter